MRIDFVDKAKGIGILLVVWGHTSLLFFKEIYAFHMPLFFFIAGFFFSVNSDFLSFLRKKMKSLILPFAIFCTFTQLYYCLLLEFSGRQYPLGWNIVWDYLPYDNELMNTPLWFLYALFWMSIFYFLLKKYVKSNGLVFCIAIALYFINEGLKDNNIQLPFFLNRSIGELIYMHIGYFCYNVLKMNNWRVFNGNRRKLFSLLLFLIVFCFSFMMKGSGEYWNLIFGVPTAFFGTMMVIALSMLLKDKFGILTYLGRHSLVVFSIHLPLLEFARPISKRLFAEGSLCYDLMTFSLLLTLSFVLGEFLMFILPKYLGKGILNSYLCRRRTI